MTTIKVSKHEILKAQWQKMIKDQNESELSIREWCKGNNIHMVISTVDRI